MTEHSDDCEGTPAGPIIDELGVRFALHPDQRVTDVVILAKVVSMDDSTVALVMADSGIDWILKRGLMAAAGEILTAEPPLSTSSGD